MLDILCFMQKKPSKSSAVAKNSTNQRTERIIEQMKEAQSLSKNAEPSASSEIIVQLQAENVKLKEENLKWRNLALKGLNKTYKTYSLLKCFLY